jgi:hypothetical protein
VVVRRYASGEGETVGERQSNGRVRAKRVGSRIDVMWRDSRWTQERGAAESSKARVQDLLAQIRSDSAITDKQVSNAQCGITQKV